MKLFRMKILKECVYICILALIIGLIINFSHPKGYVLVSKTDLRHKKIVAISIAEAKIKYDSGKALFIDARSLAAYKEGHIKDAVNIAAYPKNLLEKKLTPHMPQINSPVELVVYCTGSTCGASKDFAEFLISKGYSRIIYLITDGFPAWDEQKFPVDK